MAATVGCLQMVTFLTVSAQRRLLVVVAEVDLSLAMRQEAFEKRLETYVKTGFPKLNLHFITYMHFLFFLIKILEGKLAQKISSPYRKYVTFYRKIRYNNVTSV